MHRFKLQHIFKLVRLISRMIRMQAAHHRAMLLLNDESNRYVSRNHGGSGTRLVKRTNVRRVQPDTQESLYDLELLRLKAAEANKKQISSNYTFTTFFNLIRPLSSRFGNRFGELYGGIAGRTHTKFKRWTDDVSHQLSLLFGLCNTSSGNIYEAFFGTSFVRIH